jgi:ubiquinone/menaquinone biosynthesis C-methylase UbiE
LAQIKAAVTWIVGKHDAYVDSKRVREIMSVSAPGEREIIEVNSGHMPRTSDEALSQFSTITRVIWRCLYGRELNADTPSRGWLAAVNDREWKRVRHGAPVNARAWWKDYLLGNNGLGYDAWALTPEYNQLINDQVNLLPEDAHKVLDLGSGTGNVSQALARRGLQDITAVDLVPEALERVKQKVGVDRVKTVAVSIEGTPCIAMGRWLAGELGGIEALARRLPASAHGALTQIGNNCNGEILSILRGNNLEIKGALRRACLHEDVEGTVRDVQSLARLCRGLPALRGTPPVSAQFAAAMESSRGLPFEDASFDAIVCSLVLSYIEHPEDSLSEMRRILKAGGTLIISSMRPDADNGRAFLNGLDLLDKTPDSELPAGYAREALKTALRTFADHSAELLRLEEEGAFHFWEGDNLARMVLQAGFDDVSIKPTCGEPPTAVIVKCKKL